jgi:hypothetical protein
MVDLHAAVGAKVVVGVVLAAMPGVPIEVAAGVQVQLMDVPVGLQLQLGLQHGDQVAGVVPLRRIDVAVIDLFQRDAGIEDEATHPDPHRVIVRVQTGGHRVVGRRVGLGIGGYGQATGQRQASGGQQQASSEGAGACRCGCWMEVGEGTGVGDAERRSPQ